MGHFDLIISTISFHHWADQDKGLREVARGLGAGGLFLLADHFVVPLQRVFFATARTQEALSHPRSRSDAMLGGPDSSKSSWHDIHKIGPLPLVAGVTARRPPLTASLPSGKG